MEVKKAKVTELQHHDKQDNYGRWNHTVKFENGDAGYCSTQDKDGAYFTVGNEVDYTIEEKTSKDGMKKYFVVKRPRTNNPYSAAPKTKGAKEFKAEAILVASTNAANVIGIRQELTEKDFPVYFNAFYKRMEAAINELYGDN